MRSVLVAVTCLVLACIAIGLGRVINKEDENDWMNPEYGGDWEGDILLDPSQTLHDLNNVSPLNSVWDRKKKWTNNILYYEIREDYNEDLMDRLAAAILDLVDTVKVNGQYCIKILPKTTQKNYVYIVDEGGCSSYVGMTGGGQRMKLAASCIKRHGTVMHEFIHALGFHHEQKRSDRDDYVTINWGNIQSGHSHNFNKLVENKTVDLLGTKYDYGSIMHYSAYAFASDRNEKTITPHDPNAKIGQREKLSELDTERIQIFYDCLKPEDSKYFKHLAGKKY